MNERGRPVASPFLVILLLGAALSACTETVFRDRLDFDEPPGAAGGFLGYDEVSTSLTVCGNCHIGQQNEWEATAHADAWATLEESGHAQEFCEPCHTVNELGNPVEETQVGWVATADPRYHDVQCESCHGPGETHLSNPDASQPLAPVAVGLDLEQGCGECHSGAHHPFVEEWVQSPHANVVQAAAGREACSSCHWGQGILQAWGVKAEYVERESAELLPITCAVCHDPHDARFEGQVRFPVQTTSVEEHLCARCHNRTTSPNPGAHGLHPHAPESALLVGDAGWFPPGSQIDQGEIAGTHGSEANEGLCATCHVTGFEVVDEETGEFVFQATGHLFRAIPCLDEQGVPTPDTECALSTEARSFAGCTGSGCHGSANAAVSALTVATGRIEDLADELIALLEQVDPNLEGAGGEIDANEPTFTTAEGAFFNWALAHHGDTFRASTTHNPFLIEALLAASIEAVEDAYGVSASVRQDWDARIRTIVERAGAQAP